MYKLKLMAAALAATTALGCAAYAADAVGTNPDRAAAVDFREVSRQGAMTFQAMTGARLALFEGDTATAVKLVADAQAALDKARTEGAAFMKAEADLVTPKGAPAKPATTADATKPVQWIPVDATMSVTEDFSVRPAKPAKLEKTSDRGEASVAAETVRPVDMRANYALAIAPVDKISDGLAKASDDLKAGKYYEANLALKAAEDGIRYEVA